MMIPNQHYLVVDDDSTSNLICDFTIRKFDSGALIAKFLIPEKALEEIEAKYSKTIVPIPTIMFLDVNMPTMTGFEFLEAFKKFDEGVQSMFTIYILSSSIEDYQIEARRFPFVAGFLSKPLKISHLEKILSQVAVKSL